MSFEVKSVIANLEQIAKDTEKESLITDNITKDLFGDPLDKSKPLWTVSDNSRVPIYLREMLSTVCTVLQDSTEHTWSCATRTKIKWQKKQVMYSNLFLKRISKILIRKEVGIHIYLITEHFKSIIIISNCVNIVILFQLVLE